MTGAEVAGAAMVGKVVRNVGKETADERKAVNKELREGAKDSPYMKDASNNYAKRVAIRQALMTQMYLPIAKLFGVANKYFEPEGQFAQDMGEKLNDVPDEHLVAPKASMAAPAMQQLGFSLDEPDLKEMYLNLLATASDDRRASGAHPSFVEVIKQLSAEEVKFLESVLNAPGRSMPIVRFKLVNEDVPGYKTVLEHIVQDTEISRSAYVSGLGPTYVDNWVRLGLVSVEYGTYLTAEGSYDWVETSHQMTGVKQAVENMPGTSVEFDRGALSPTSFGKSFGTAAGILEK